MPRVGSLSVFAFDCPDPRSLARFWGAVLDQPVAIDEPDWVTLDPGPGRTALAFQKVDDYRPPQWPGQSVPQQAHVDVVVDDLDAGEEQVLEFGARRVGQSQDPEDEFRVYLDPAGHPFCLVLLD